MTDQTARLQRLSLVYDTQVVSFVFKCSGSTLLLCILYSKLCMRNNNIPACLIFTYQEERGGLVVESLTSKQEVGGSKSTSAVLCP